MTTRRSMLQLAPALILAALSAPAFAQTPDLSNPAALVEKAPATYKVRFDTSKGPFVIQVHRAWAPNGADRFYNLVKHGFYDNDRFFRVISGFMVQFGINGDPRVSAHWRDANIQDDPVKQSNKRGMITFATAGPNTRTTQVFINFARQFRARRPGLRAVRAGGVGHERGRRPQRRIRRRRAARQRARAGPPADAKAMPI